MKRLVPEMLERSRLKIKSRAQQITLKPNIMKVKKLLANVSLFTIQHILLCLVLKLFAGLCSLSLN
jgi:hypothetical protein